MLNKYFVGSLIFTSLIFSQGAMACEHDQNFCKEQACDSHQPVSQSSEEESNHDHG